MTRILGLVTLVPSFRLADLVARLLEADRRYRQVRHLRNLPPHMLADIGLTARQAAELAAEVQSGASM